MWSEERILGMVKTMSTDAKRILMVEDDEELASLIVDYLQSNGLTVEVVTDGPAAETRARDEPPDLIILDLMLPTTDGLDVCREMRRWFSGPILMLTARSGWVDEIVGLEVGADDYLGKPVEPRLLLARIKSLLRRAGPSPEIETPDSPKLRIDTGKRRAYVGDTVLELTDAEFELLVYLKQHAEQQISREELYKSLLGIEYDGMDRTIDVRISRLRTKLDAYGPRWIRSVRGVGYIFADEE